MKITVNPKLKLENFIGKNCPCRIQKTDDTVCPCRDFRENLNCKCNLFLINKEEYDTMEE